MTTSTTTDQKPQTDWAEMGRQLRHPQGEEGIKIGLGMNEANMGMIRRMFELINLTTGQHVLEIGPGNAVHVKEILSARPGVQYTGVEISETMLNEAAQNCRATMNVSFLLVDGKSLPFADEAFDRVVSSNTIYFWENPSEYAREISRVLKKGDGMVCLAFVAKSFMEKLPFTREGFDLYDEQEVKTLLAGAGLEPVSSLRETETVRTNTGVLVERDRYFVLAKKV